MKPMALVSLTTAFALTVMLPVAAWAGGSSATISGPRAQAAFDTTNGCLETFVELQAEEVVSHDPPGPPGARSEASVLLGVFDNCTSTSLLNGFGSVVLAPLDFHVEKTLTSATLNTTINVFDFVSNTSFDVSVNLTWTSTGQIETLSDRTLIRFPGGFTNIRSTSNTRKAVATGRVVVGTTNFTPDPTPFASIFNVRTGFATVFFPQ